MRLNQLLSYITCELVKTGFFPSLLLSPLSRAAIGENTIKARFKTCLNYHYIQIYQLSWNIKSKTCPLRILQCGYSTSGFLIFISMRYSGWNNAYNPDVVRFSFNQWNISQLCLPSKKRLHSLSYHFPRDAPNQDQTAALECSQVCVCVWVWWLCMMWHVWLDYCMQLPVCIFILCALPCVCMCKLGSLCERQRGRFHQYGMSVEF